MRAWTAPLTRSLGLATLTALQAPEPWSKTDGAPHQCIDQHVGQPVHVQAAAAVVRQGACGCQGRHCPGATCPARGAVLTMRTGSVCKCADRGGCWRGWASMCGCTWLWKPRCECPFPSSERHLAPGSTALQWYAWNTGACVPQPGLPLQGTAAQQTHGLFTCSGALLAMPQYQKSRESSPHLRAGSSARVPRGAAAAGHV